MLVDGGVRRGSDVIKAMALGADAVFAGRAVLYRVAAAGRAGADRALDILREEIDRDLGLLGVRSIGGSTAACSSTPAIAGNPPALRNFCPSPADAGILGGHITSRAGAERCHRIAFIWASTRPAALGERAMRGIGYDAEEARIVTDHVIDAALCGYEYSGLAKLLNIPEHRRFGTAAPPIRLLHETEVSALYDGGNNVGMLAMYHAAQATIAKAEAHGIAVVGVTNSWMSGRSAYFVEMIAQCRLCRDPHREQRRRGRAARRDQAGARHQPDRLRDPDRRGAADPRHGHLGLYGDRAAIARAPATRSCPKASRSTATGGRPPTRPRRRPARSSPFAGYKGFGLGLIVQALGVLGGAGMVPGGEDGYLFIAFRPGSAGAARPICKREVSALIARVKAVPRAAGCRRNPHPGRELGEAAASGCRARG